MVPSVLFMCISGNQRNPASSCEKLGLESNSSFLFFFPFGQHPFLQTAVSLSVLPETIRIARKVCEAMEVLHGSSTSSEKNQE